MRIFIVNDFMGKKGGAEIYDHKLKRLLEKEGHKVASFGGTREQYHSTKHLFNSYFNIRTYLQVEKILEEFKPDIIFAHDITLNISPSFLLAAKKYSIPVVHKPGYLGAYKFPPPQTPSYLLRCLRTFIHRKMIKRYVDRYIAPSFTSAKCLVSQLKINEEKISIIRNFIDWEIRKQKKERKENKILFVGRFYPQKGVTYLIKALKYIKIEKKVELDLIGTGPEITSLKKLVMKNGLSKNVKFHGYVPNEKLPEIYAKASVFVLPSIDRENSPLTPLEAMSQGTPVITTNIGGQSELVRNGFNGYLIEPKAPKELAEKIEILLENPQLRRKLGENGKIFIKKIIPTPKQHVRKIERLFTAVIEGKKIE